MEGISLIVEQSFDMQNIHIWPIVVKSIGQPNNDTPSCRIMVLCSCIAMGCDPTRSMFIYNNYLYVNDWSKCMSGMFMQSHAMSCKVMQMSCKVMQCHAKSCNVCKCLSRQVESHICLVNFTLLLWHFACIQAFSGSWSEVAVYHR